MNAWKLLRPPLVAGTVLAGQMARAILRDDLPSLDNQDPSGIFGEPGAPPLRLVFLGDSSVTAPGVDPLDHSWPRQMAMHLAKSYRVEAISFAVGGSKVRDVLGDQVDAALASEPDIAYVAVGSNDALRGTPIARFEAEFDEVVSRLYDRVPAIGLSGIGDLGTIPRIPELARGVARVRARAIDRAIQRVAAEYPCTIKSWVWDVMAIDFAQRPELFAGDLFHASAEGHLAFATIGMPMADRLVEVLERNGDSRIKSQESRTKSEEPRIRG
jgi:lysophospholipase L1-like esterase